MAIGSVDVGQELLNVPMGDMIRSMALAIAEGQWELDKTSMVVTELMSGRRLIRDFDTGEMVDEDGEPTGKPRVMDSRVFFGYDYEWLDPADPNEGYRRTPVKVSMMELGFTPTFYQFVDTLIEVKISITITGTTETTRAASVSQRSSSSASRHNNNRHWWRYGSSAGASSHRAQASQVNARYSNRFSYSVEGSSLLRTKLVPVPPPAILEERIRELMAIEAAFQEQAAAIGDEAAVAAAQEE